MNYDGPSRPQRTSELLRALGESAAGRISIRDIAERVGPRSFGLVLLVLALPAWIPILPPGVASIFGVAMLVLAVQLVLARPMPWLPRFVADYALPADRFAALTARTAPWLGRVEIVCRPRMTWVFDHHVAARLVALWVVVLALAVCVPLPMTNSWPALSMAVMALGLIERDGLAVLAGSVLGAFSIGLMVAFWGGAFVILKGLFGA